jgi:hypothetical protein
MGERSDDSLRNFKIESSLRIATSFPLKPPNHVVIPKHSEGSPDPITLLSKLEPTIHSPYTYKDTKSLANEFDKH